jgi:DNA repair protein RecN (Recombination protein N)
MQRIDLLRFQVEEIDAAVLREGEEDELVAERARLANAERLALDASAVYAAITGGEDPDAQQAALPMLQKATRILEEMAGVDGTVWPLREKLTELTFLLEDIGAEAREYRDAIDANPSRLAVVEERLAELRQLQRKYGASTADILRHAREAEQELERLTGSESNAEALAERDEGLSHEIGELARALSGKRAEAATVLAGDVEEAIARLNMGAASFAVSLDRTEDPGGVPVRMDDGESGRFAVDASGIDRVIFLIAPNVGEGLKPLSKIASGGETARLMLALKSILSEADQTPTLVFDEIDVGVGGRSGQVVGEMLWDLAAGHQVIAITHLPQIAAFADTHFKIAKFERDGRVISTVDELAASARIEELAAMLDGLPVTASARQTAEEMLKRAAAAKQPR